jgi:enoyl-[acyl-carrier protein] reductase II
MNRITELLKIKLPIVQGGMVWCSGWELAAAVSNAGGLGLIGAGSMSPEVLKMHIAKCRMATPKPFGVNIPLLYPHAEEFVKIVIDERVPVVFTSAGNPMKWTSTFKNEGITVVHVVANAKGAVKCENAGVDAIVAEGHNGKEETTTMVLIPLIRQAVNLPLIAAGGIATGAGMLAAMALGAEGVQIGSRFVASAESSAHVKFKQMIVDAKDGDTDLVMKRLVSVRLLKNEFHRRVLELEQSGASDAELRELLGKGRAKAGMFDGDTVEGELEIGQVSALIDNVLPVEQIVKDIVEEYNQAIKRVKPI